MQSKAKGFYYQRYWVLGEGTHLRLRGQSEINKNAKPPSSLGSYISDRRNQTTLNIYTLFVLKCKQKWISIS